MDVPIFAYVKKTDWNKYLNGRLITASTRQCSYYHELKKFPPEHIHRIEYDDSLDTGVLFLIKKTNKVEV